MVASALRRAGGGGGPAALPHLLTDYSGQKIDTSIDLDRLKYVHDEGEKVLVTVVRGTRRFTRELTLGR